MKVKAYSLWGEDVFSVGLEVCCLRGASNEAQASEQNAVNTAAQLGGEAGGELATLSPFYQREMTAEHAYDPTQLNEMLTAAEAGTGATTGAMQTALQRQGATTGNAAGQTKALQDLARDRMKANAGASENIAAQDVQGAMNLRQAGAAGESGLYGTNLKGQLAAMGQEASDINAQIDASKTGWLQNAEGIAKTASGIASGFGG